VWGFLTVEALRGNVLSFCVLFFHFSFFDFDCSYCNIAWMFCVGSFCEVFLSCLEVVVFNFVGFSMVCVLFICVAICGL